MARNDGVDETAGSESYEEHGQRVQGMLVGFVLPNQLVDYFLG